MPRAKRPGLRPNWQWVRIIADVLMSHPPVQQAAWAIVEREVIDHVECQVALPLDVGVDDGQARRVIAQRVIQILQAESFSVLEEWRRRVLRGTDSSSFYAMIKAVAFFAAIGYARDAP